MQNKSPDFLKLQDFFYWLIRNLEKFVTPLEYKAQLSFLRCVKRKIITTAITLGLLDREIPFLPVLQSGIKARKSIFVSRQVKFVKINGISGTFETNINKIRDLDDKKIPRHHPYFLIDVNLNTDLVGLNAEEAREKIISRGEIPLSLAECVSLLIHKPEILLKYSIVACGSEYSEAKNGKQRRTPCVLLFEGTPTIRWCFSESRDNKSIYPSCSKRVGIIGIMAYIQGRPWRMVGPI